MQSFSNDELLEMLRVAEKTIREKDETIENLKNLVSKSEEGDCSKKRRVVFVGNESTTIISSHSPLSSSSSSSSCSSSSLSSNSTALSVLQKMQEEEGKQELVLANSYSSSSSPLFFYNTIECAQYLKTAADLSRHFLFENRILKERKHDSTKKIRIPTHVRNELITFGCSFGLQCYQCCRGFRSEHPIYSFLCRVCGDMNFRILREQHNPEHTKHVVGMLCFVSGGRTKIGYQTALRLLRNGAVVIITSRFPERASSTYMEEIDSSKWIHNLRIYPESFDLNKSASEMSQLFSRFRTWIESFSSSLDVIINVAAQTIRGIERHRPIPSDGANRYGDRKHFPDGLLNSWNLRLGEVPCEEIEEVFRINAIAPFLLVQELLPLLLKSKHPRRMVINTHAREGLFNIAGKSSLHPHTNMAKSALHQLTMMINRTRFYHQPCPNPSSSSSTSSSSCGETISRSVSEENAELPYQKIAAYGIDPGWVSIDEYGSQSVPLLAPLLSLSQPNNGNENNNNENSSSSNDITATTTSTPKTDKKKKPQLSESTLRFLRYFQKKNPSALLFQGERMPAAPLTELDGASRLLFPLLSKKRIDSSIKTIRHFYDKRS